MTDIASRFCHLRTMCLLLALLLSACSTLNEGQIDYRRANGKNSELHELAGKYKMPVESELIHKGETVSVHLHQAFIKTFTERTDAFLNAVTFGQVKIRGEIAIVAKVFEVGSGNTLDFTLSATKSGGRLIYFSGDVRPGGHFLNFSSLPIYGPITYEGRALVIQLSVIEMDNAESAQIKSLLKTLAGIGALAYPPASPVLAVLDRVGGELLKGDTDDVDFRYSFVLHPGFGPETDKTNHPVLSTGNYLLVKEEPGCGSFCNDTPWETIKLAPHHGRLVTSEPGAPLFKDKTYLVVQINKGFDAVQMDTAQAFSAFETAYLSQAAAGRVDPAGIIGELDVQLKRSVTFSRANGKLSRAADTRATQPAMARELVREALDTLRADLNETDTKKQVLSSEQREALVRRLRLFPAAKPEVKDLTVDQVKTKDVAALLTLLNL